MIIRESSDGCLLISQVEHARVAAAIAAAWQLPEALTGQSGDFGYAVLHHDDGWRDWERAPTIDGDGRPRDFMEMPMPVATRLWRRSIEIAGGRSAWCGLWVSRHFCELAEHAIGHRKEPEDQQSLREFLTDQAAFQQRWRASAGPAATAEGNSPIEVAGLHALQFFDRLSLWLCCAERTRPLDIDDPSGKMSRWAPRGGETIVVECVKFTAAELILTAPSVEIPRQTYASDADLRGAISAGKRVTLSWTLVAPTLEG